MARFTKEALVKVKEMFDTRELILLNNKIYYYSKEDFK